MRRNEKIEEAKKREEMRRDVTRSQKKKRDETINKKQRTCHVRKKATITAISCETIFLIGAGTVKIYLVSL